MKRSEIEEKYKWDLSEYCSNDEECLQRALAQKQKFPLITAFEGKLKNSGEIFSLLLLQSEIEKELGIIGAYSHFRVAENAGNSKSMELDEKIGTIFVEYSGVCSFIAVEIGELSEQQILELQNDKEYPQFSLFFKEINRNRKYILSKKEEKLISQISDFSGGFSDSFDMFDNVDVKYGEVCDSNGKKYSLSHATYSLLISSSDKVLRKNAFCRMQQAYGDYINTISSLYINTVKEDCFYAKIRGYDSALAKSIFGEEASEKVYNILIKGVNSNLNIFWRAFEIKRKELGLEKFNAYDAYAISNQKFDIKVEYETAIKMIKDATSCLGSEYVKLVDRAYSERWIDVFENEGKDGGAFSSGAFGVHPVVLMNYVQNTNSVFTLAHELGHCMHTYFSENNQPFEKSGYTIFVAEVASNVNEFLLLFNLLSKATTKQEKCFYYDHILTQFRGSVFRQTMFAEFEQFSHETYEKEKCLSKDALCEKYYSLCQTYFGNKVDLPTEIKYEWARIPHFYSSFYVYKYATGLICALVLAKNIFERKDGAKENYIGFLKSGGTLPPVELLKNAGVDLEKEATFDDAFSYLSNILDEWEKSF